MLNSTITSSECKLLHNPNANNYSLATLIFPALYSVEAHYNNFSSWLGTITFLINFHWTLHLYISFTVFSLLSNIKTILYLFPGHLIKSHDFDTIYILMTPKSRSLFQRSWVPDLFSQLFPCHSYLDFRQFNKSQSEFLFFFFYFF